MSESAHWNERYQKGETPWDTGQPSGELQRVVAEDGIVPCRAVELGCGTGTNALWLAQQGFDVTGIDLARLAIEKARQKATWAGVPIHFLVADILNLPDLGKPFGFLLDRGCYHAVRRDNAADYVQAIDRLLRPGGIGLILAGNAREPHEPGPPVVSEEEIHREVGRVFTIRRLREFRFDPPPGTNERFLAWSCLFGKE